MSRMPSNRQPSRRFWLGAIGLVLTTGLTFSASVTASGNPTSSSSSPELAAPEIADAPSAAELEDLRTIADQSGMSLQAAIDRYAWNDNFALAMAKIREAYPESFTGAEIVDGTNAWVAFADQPPHGALDVVDTFRTSHGRVSVEVRTGLGFTEVELTKAIETVHYAVFARPEVVDATTSFDFDAGRITTTVVLISAPEDSALDGLRAVATDRIVTEELGSILDSVSLSVVESIVKVIGGDESNTQHRGGELINGSISCTTGFGTKTSTGARGIATAGHCSNAQSDDGVNLTFKGGYEGTHGDFQWHTGPQTLSDDFYSGDSASTEVSLRDVIAVGSPVVDQSLCRNGRTSHKDCQDVRKVNVCKSVYCNLVQMDAHLSADGDSGGPVYFGNTAYGIHQGWHWDIWPFDREVFSRADRIDNALNIFIATG